jgi:DNA-binding response OmpR family regulator
MSRSLIIVVVEDHELSRQALVALLQHAGHQVIGVDCAEAVDDEGAQAPSDLLIVDLNLPGESGLSLTRRLRAAHPQLGVIMVTSQSSTADRIAGFQSGVDIYLSKPIDPDEILAAVDSLARRLPGGDAASAASSVLLEQSGLRLSGEVSTVQLTPDEALILRALAGAAGQRLENWQLIELLGKDPDRYRKAALEVRMVRLRNKLHRVSARDACLIAVRGVGYQLGLTLRTR